MEIKLFILVVLYGIYNSTESTTVNSIEENEVQDDKAMIHQLIATVNEMKEREIRTQILIQSLEIKVEAHAKEIVELKAEHEHTIDKIVPSNEGSSIDTNTRTTSDQGERKQVKDKRGTTIIEKANISFRQRAAPEQGVAFFATLGTTVEHLGKGQNVKFENVVTNIGNGYNPNIGVFIAPIAGTYVFSTTITTLLHHSSHYGFFKNGVQLTVMYLNGGESSWDSTSDTIVVRLAVGDDIEVRCTDTDHAVTGGNHSMFSGFWLIDNTSDAIVG